MKNRLSKLIDLKSIITMLLVITLVVIVMRNMSIADKAVETLFVSTVSSVFTYYFTKKSKSED